MPISIHTPAKGVTARCEYGRDVALDFNPHSREGSDYIVPKRIRERADFNPHSREGSDEQSVHGKSLQAQFQSTLPRRE